MPDMSISGVPVRQAGVGKIDRSGISGQVALQGDGFMKRFLTVGVVFAVATLVLPQQAGASQNPTEKSVTPVPPASTAPVPAGSYTLDRQHASLVFRVSHLGFSNYTARFKRFDAKLDFDPRDLAASKVLATVEADSLETDYPDPAKLDFNGQLKGAEWLDVAKYPQMKFASKRVEVTGKNTVRIQGELTLRGVTRPIVLEARFNGGYAGHPLDPNARIGFSAHGTLKRSEFGIAFGIPAPGTTMGVSDEVNVVIEAEFTGPPLASAQKAS
jgi:polyisoprenoid-binding protein YceI